ncbi:MAG TPA: FabA/FabZ family ACP-dehydratase [Bryobacteraceae bacterium]|jgi:3-hydroxyacyl-[acyl-carrier-protein] dehydratase
MLTGPELLEQLPQQEPFRFVDEVLEADARHIVCRYTFRPDEAYYRGHFPDQPMTPGVILLEAMAQSGVVLQGLYLLLREGGSAQRYRTLFTDAQVEWHVPVGPGETVTIHAELLGWRRMRIRSRVDLRIKDGRLAASGVLGGMGVEL